MTKLPATYTKLRRTYPEIAEAYDQFGAACMRAGPIDAKTRALIKLAISIGARLEGATHAHARKALAAGASVDEARHVAFLAMTTLGFPSAVAALTWIEDVVGHAKKSPPRRGSKQRKGPDA